MNEDAPNSGFSLKGMEYHPSKPWLPFIYPCQFTIEWANILTGILLVEGDECEMSGELVEDLLRRNFGLDLQIWKICKEKVVAIQQGLHRKAVCVVYHQFPSLTSLLYGRPLSEVYKDAPVPPADMGFLGVWSNSLSKDELAWMLNVTRAPTYFTHELATEEVVDWHEGYTYHPGTMTKLETHFPPQGPYDAFAIDKDVEYLMEGIPSGACSEENISFLCHTSYSSSCLQGYDDLCQARDYSTATDVINKLGHGYHDWDSDEEGYWMWHEIIPGLRCYALIKERIPMVEVLKVIKPILKDGKWKHAYQGWLEFPSSYVTDPNVFGAPIPRWRAYCFTEDREGSSSDEPNDLHVKALPLITAAVKCRQRRQNVLSHSAKELQIIASCLELLVKEEQTMDGQTLDTAESSSAAPHNGWFPTAAP
ncbi:hypothetical protein ARMSODRAFT_982378 [Armillaria solidipes]|uniref:Uncharacterized protein n=1 Tax=Armillaria solidipes TaxID=1076256 RepID=A0A2H3B701_9AGAR|nr:hypothetical protein ARMSODRAFT_982378 [Armillaria solidipes]